MSDQPDLAARFGGYATFTSGESDALCHRLLAPVRSGRKTATCGALRDCETAGPMT